MLHQTPNSIWKNASVVEIFQFHLQLQLRASATKNEEAFNHAKDVAMHFHLTFNDDHNNARTKKKDSRMLPNTTRVEIYTCHPRGTWKKYTQQLSKRRKAEILQFNVKIYLIFIYNQVLQYDNVREVQIVVCILIFLKVENI